MINNRNTTTVDLDKIRKIIGYNGSPETNPFSPEFATAGVENELQTAVIGKYQYVDLPIQILNSTFYKNLEKRVKTGDVDKKILIKLNNYIFKKNDVWENSWVRFPLKECSSFTIKVLKNDLLKDKKDIKSGNRDDVNDFIFNYNSEKWIRIPVSYLLKLSLAEYINIKKDSNVIFKAGKDYMRFFLNDNTSPEIVSFYPVNFKDYDISKETSKRYLFTQLLIEFANKKFNLYKYGQKVVIYFAPTPPIRQRELNDIISDNFYRELFISPCLSGWDKGEEKKEYMILCHKVLSRSQINAVKKLKEAGIITRNLVVLPNISNVSLANNGTHLSIGSNVLSSLFSNNNGFTEKEEKYLGDLAIKIIEHFLPLFVGTYSASPYKLDFKDFHPEIVLNFLPHELDFTHLRMLWRRWKKKAKIKIFTVRITPFGPEFLDKLISKIFQLKGDFVCDYRVIDYLISLLSTNDSPAFNGDIDSEQKLKEDLTREGIFDEKMSLYFLLKLRQFYKHNFSGFEARFYSVFKDFINDFSNAAKLQLLVTALAYKYILEEDITHNNIPDDPSVESERRQIFFGTAIGIPTSYIKKKTKNQFLQKILKLVDKKRLSLRYSGYIRIYNKEYNKALIKLIEDDGKDLIESFGFANVIEDLKKRISDKQYSVCGKITESIVQKAKFKNPIDTDAYKFNLTAENYYREQLKYEHIKEGINILLDEIKEEKDKNLLKKSSNDFLKENISLNDLIELITITILNISSYRSC